MVGVRSDQTICEHKNKHKEKDSQSLPHHHHAVRNSYTYQETAEFFSERQESRRKSQKEHYQEIDTFLSLNQLLIMFWSLIIVICLLFHHKVCVFAASSLRPPNIVPKPLNTMLRSTLKIQKYRIEQFEKLDGAYDIDSSNAIKGSKIFMEPIFTLQGHLDAVECIDWNNEGTLLSSGSRDKIARVWDTRNGRLELQLNGHHDFVTCVSMSPKGKRIATAGRDETVRIWDLQTGQCKRIFDDHCSPVSFVKYNEQGTKLAFGYRDEPIRIVNTEITEQKETTLIEGLTGRVVRVSWSPDGTVLATGNISLFPLSPLLPYPSHTPSHTPLIPHPLPLSYPISCLAYTPSLASFTHHRRYLLFNHRFP